MFESIKKVIKPLVPRPLILFVRCWQEQQKKISVEHHKNSSLSLQGLSYEKAETATKLHLGCGSNIFQGWLNADLVTTDSVPPDTHEKISDIFIMDATTTFPFRDNQMNFIYCEDFIEHFSQKDGISLCAECYRILKQGGVWRISTPSFDKILRGMQPRERKAVDFRNWGWGHKLLYTEDYITFVLKQCGFRKIIKCSFRESWFEELKNIDTRVDQIDLNLIVDAIK